MWAEEFYLPFISRLGGARCAAWAAVAVMPEKRETRNSSWSGGGCFLLGRERGPFTTQQMSRCVLQSPRVTEQTRGDTDAAGVRGSWWLLAATMGATKG